MNAHELPGMANLINIPRNVEDEFYRYRIPKMIAKIEGRGYGIKTAILNMSDIARALNRLPAYTIKYFGIELGAQTIIDSKSDRYIVCGTHGVKELNDCLDNFIDRFVLCKACKHPETELLVFTRPDRSANVVRGCRACGGRTGVDMRHGLASFIVKNPPVKCATKATKKSGGVGDGGIWMKHKL